MKITVIICTHSPRADYLQRTLSALKKQSLPKDQWELLLIDNASAEPLDDKWDLSWHPNARYILEGELGLTPARLCGIKNSAGELLIFVDDDNLLDTDYLTVAAQIHRCNPALGAFGAGIICPEFEITPSADILPFTRHLALRNTQTVIWSNDPLRRPRPCGAGLCVTKELAIRYHKVISKAEGYSIFDRKGVELFSGGDDEFAFIACQMGLGHGVFPDLCLTHLIPAHRITKEYLLRLREGIAFSSVLLKKRYGIEVFEQESEPSLPSILINIFTLHPGRVYRNIIRLINLRRLSPVQADMELATRNGMRAAFAHMRMKVK
jgi:glycosyltransferase involved in cell wall biosynthesis